MVPVTGKGGEARVRRTVFNHRKHTSLKGQETKRTQTGARDDRHSGRVDGQRPCLSVGQRSVRGGGRGHRQLSC